MAASPSSKPLMDNRNWLCIRTTTGREALAASRLESRRIETFAPRTLGLSRAFGVSREVARALFPGYFFAFASLPEYQNAALGMRKEILCVLGFGSGPAVVDGMVIDEIRARIADDGFVYLAESQMAGERFMPNQPVIVTDGPLEGYEGLFVRDEKQRVIVLMTFLGGLREIPLERSQIAAA